MTFYKEVNTFSRETMVKFLENHCRYYTGNGCGFSPATSYANNMKIYNLGLPRDVEENLLSLLDCPEAYDGVNRLIRKFGKAHGNRWQAEFNGRSGGYLVLYQGEAKPTEHKSYCMACGQLNFKTIEESGNNVCGRCGKAARVNLVEPIVDIHVFPGRGVDDDEDFEFWNTDQLKDRVKLVQEFDALCDNIVAEACRLADECEAVEETVYIPKTRKVMVQKKQEGD